MTTPSDPEQEQPAEGVNLGKGEPTADAPFDPYRFGRPDHPIPAEYAPPGYTGPTIPAGTPYQAPNAWAPPTDAGNPFSNPPGTPYGPPPQQPYQHPPPGQYGPGAPPPGQYGPGAPPPGPYVPGAPPPPPYHGYVQPRSGNGKAIAALVLGIASIVFCWLFFFDAIFVILGLIFSLIAMSETKQSGRSGRGIAIAGLVCTIIGALLAVWLTVRLVHAVDQCGGFSNSNASNWTQCVRDNF